MSSARDEAMGSLLVRARTLRGQTQTQAGTELGVSRRTIVRLERGECASLTPGNFALIRAYLLTAGVADLAS